MRQPPSIGDGEITVKGNLNAGVVLSCRAALLERLYAGGDDAAVLTF